MDDHRPLRTFGRIKARTLKPRQAGLMETLLPHLAVPAEGEIDVAQLFSPSPLVGEGGVGGVSAALSSFGADTPTPNPAPQGGGERRADAVALWFAVDDFDDLAWLQTNNAGPGGFVFERVVERGDLV